jgi:hypothetical protein
MDSILTVLTTAASYDLTTLANVKAELGVTGSAQDSKLKLYIQQASGAIADHCNRVFALEAVREQFRFSLGLERGVGWGRQRGPQNLVLRRRPVVSPITSIVENEDPALVEGTDFEVDYKAGLVTRLSNGFPCWWARRKIVVSYSAGHELLGDLPQAVERACILLVKFYNAKGQRDPLLRAEEVPGVMRFDYQVNQVGDDGGLPPDVLSLLSLHVEPRLA